VSELDVGREVPRRVLEAEHQGLPVRRLVAVVERHEAGVLGAIGPSNVALLMAF
jgi:hypothetical protein